MSIWASDHGIDCWDCKRGCKNCDHIGLPYVYEHSGVMPHGNRPRGGRVDLAHLSKFVRYYRQHPNATFTPPGIEPWLRLSVAEPGTTDATVVLHARQVRWLRDHLTGWLDDVEATS